MTDRVIEICRCYGRKLCSPKSVGRPKNKMTECHPEGHITGPRNTRMEDMRWGYRRKEVSFEGGQGLEEAAVPHMDGWRCYGMEMSVKLTKIVRISRKPSPEQIIYKKEWQNVEYFNYFDSTVTNDAKCTH
jgi:hypothetical protein